MDSRLTNLAKGGMLLLFGVALLAGSAYFYSESRRLATSTTGEPGPSQTYEFLTNQIFLPLYNLTHATSGTTPAPASFAQFLTYVLLFAGLMSFVLLVWSFLVFSRKRAVPANS